MTSAELKAAIQQRFPGFTATTTTANGYRIVKASWVDAEGFENERYVTYPVGAGAAELERQLRALFGRCRRSIEAGDGSTRKPVDVQSAEIKEVRK